MPVSFLCFVTLKAGLSLSARHTADLILCLAVCDQISQLQVTAEQRQRASDRDVHGSGGQFPDPVDVAERVNAARVSDRKSGLSLKSAQYPHKVILDP